LSLAIRAFLLAVVTAALVGTLGMIALFVIPSWAEGGQAFSITDLKLLLLFFIYFAVFSVASLAIFGITLTAVLSKFQLERGWTYPMLGFVVGLAMALFFLIPGRGSYTSQMFLFQLLAGAVPGWAAGFVWWRAYRRTRAHDEVVVR
jgi:hypothetical protein